MGFNVQGIAVSKKFESAQELADAIGLGNIEKTGETAFENAMSYSIADNDIYITGVPGGTVVTFGTAFDIEDMPLAGLSGDGRALRFLVGETAMVFAFEYFEDGESRRSLMYFDGENRLEEGDPLPAEALETDLTDLIFGLVGQVTGTAFYSIEPDQLSEQYRVRPYDTKVRPLHKA